MNDVYNQTQVSTILIIDDDLLGTQLMRRGLEMMGFQVLVANNGPEGRQLAVEFQPDLVLLDKIMPDEDGLETLRYLKGCHETCQIPVIFLSGHQAINAKVHALETGAVDYILKPCHIAEVKARVGLHIKMNRATRAQVEMQAAKLRQLEAAQKAILVQPGELSGVPFGVYYQTFFEVGGDFYDVLPISDRITGFFVGDVSGHDMASGIATASVNALLKHSCNSLYSPAESMIMINSVLVEVLPPGKYLTACYAVLNHDKGELTIISMAHPPVLLLPADGPARLLENDGDVLGAFPNVSYPAIRVEVQRGDRFFLYSDGLLERGEEPEVWSALTDELPERAEGLRGLPIQQAADLLNEMFEQAHGQTTDDIVVLGYEVS